MPPPIRTTMVSAVPVMQRPPMGSVVRLPHGSVLASSMPPILHAPRINVVPMPPNPPPMMPQRAPHMLVPTGIIYFLYGYSVFCRHFGNL